jgi:hypothetical protein
VIGLDAADVDGPAQHRRDDREAVVRLSRTVLSAP